jgi:hypothetical protein
MLGKHHRRPFTTSTTPRATAPFDLIHSDLDGPMQTQSIAERATYLLTYIDDHTRYSWVFFLRTKDEQPQAFQEFHAMVETQFKQKIKILRTDRGGEYQSSAFESYLKELGIIHQRTIPDTPQQNGLAERSNRTIVGSGKSMLHSTGLTYGFWVEAIRTAAHVRNRSPSRVIDWKTPHEMLTGRKPDISYFRIFGCKGFVNVLKKKRKHKMEPTSSPLTFIGYEPHSKGYRFWNPRTRTITVATDVTFDEETFTHKPIPPCPAPPASTPVPDTTDARLPDVPPDSDDEIVTRNDENQPALPVPDDTEKVAVLPRLKVEDTASVPSRPSTPPPPSPLITVRVPPRPEPSQNAPRNISSRDRGQQSRAPPLDLPPRRSTRLDPNKPRQPPPNDTDLDGTFWNSFLQADDPSLYAVLLPGEPATYRQAINAPDSKQWELAMEEEINSLKKHGTWQLVDLPTGRQPVKCKWVYRLKFDANGDPIRHKARLVAKGFTQIYGLDF